MADVVITGRDGTLNELSFQGSQTADGDYLRNVALADSSANGQTAQVANHSANGVSITGSVYDLLCAALLKVTTADGVTWDTVRAGGIDGAAASGLLGTAALVLQPVTTTVTTTVAASSASATLSTASTAGFTVNAPLVLEPGTARAESARITAVVANTSITIAFATVGALYTHTANYTVMTGAMNAQRQAPGATGVQLVSLDGYKATYRAGAVGQTLYSTAAAVLVEIVGSATFTVRVKTIKIWAQAGTKFYTELELLRCTAASGGTPSTANKGQHDKNDSAGTATINYYTAAAAAGTGNAIIGASPMNTLAPTASVGMTPTRWNFCADGAKGLILRGTGDVIEIYNTITGLGTATFGFEVVWEEDLS